MRYQRMILFRRLGIVGVLLLTGLFAHRAMGQETEKVAGKLAERTELSTVNCQLSMNGYSI